MKLTIEDLDCIRENARRAAIAAEEDELDAGFDPSAPCSSVCRDCGTPIPPSGRHDCRFDEEDENQQRQTIEIDAVGWKEARAAGLLGLLLAVLPLAALGG